MATYYVSSVDGDDLEDGSTWALAKATIAGALAVATVSGDIIYVDSAHAESQATTLTWNIATSGAGVSIISVDRNGSTTTGHNGWLAGASVTISASGVGVNIASSGSQHLFMSGVVINQNSGNSSNNSIIIANSTGNVSVEAEDCTFNIPGTASPQLALGGSNTSSTLQAVITLRDCEVILPNRTSSVAAIALRAAQGRIINLTVTPSANQPATLIGGAITGLGDWTISNSDVSPYNRDGGALVDAATWRGTLRMRNCKLSATPAIVSAGTWINNSASVWLVNCDSGDTKNVFEYHSRLGTLLESTSIYTDAGEQYQGDSRLSWQIVTTAACNEHEPFVLPPLLAHQAATGAKTARLELVCANTLTDRECWMEVSVVEDAGFPLGTMHSTRNAQPFDGSAANLASSSVAWTGAGGLTKQKIEKAINPAEKCTLEARLVVAKASETLYLDPGCYIE